MTSPSLQLDPRVRDKALELGVSPEIFASALNIICQNRNLVNAIDHSTEMDDYIYRAILKQAFDKRRAKAVTDLNSDDLATQRIAQKELAILEREELTSDAFYRAVLPLIVKVVNKEPILRLHAEEASTIVLELADFKRRYRATSLTEIIVKRCIAEIDAFQTV